MKIDLNFLKPKKVFKKDNFVINPNIYWQIVVSFGLVVIFSSLGYGFYLFKKISREPDSPESSVVNNTQKIKKERFEAISQYFYTKEKKSLEILNSPLLIKDPSVIYGAPTPLPLTPVPPNPAPAQ